MKKNNNNMETRETLRKVKSTNKYAGKWIHVRMWFSVFSLRSIQMGEIMKKKKKNLKPQYERDTKNQSQNWNRKSLAKIKCNAINADAYVDNQRSFFSTFQYEYMYGRDGV